MYSVQASFLQQLLLKGKSIGNLHKTSKSYGSKFLKLLWGKYCASVPLKKIKFLKGMLKYSTFQAHERG
jgi:hypothetical protein